jgi:hypothetical protein
MTNGGSREEPAEQTVGGFDSAGRAWVLALFAVGGLALGALLPVLSSWAAGLPWVPFQGPLKLLGSSDRSWLVWGRPALGLLIGVGFAIWVILNSPELDISHDEILVRRHGQVERVIQRATVDAVYRRGSKIVIETDRGRTLFEDDVEGDKSAVRNAFVTNDYPWEGPRD